MRNLIVIATMFSLFACNQSKTKDKEAVKKNSSGTVTDNTRNPMARDQRIMSPDESMINGLLKSNGHEKWRLITDKEARVDSFDYYLKIVNKRRMKNPEFPFIAKGDFNGDGKIDYAALVVTDEKFDSVNVTKVVMFLTDGEMMVTEADSDNHTTVDLSPKSSSVHGILENGVETNIKLKFDAIAVSNWDAGGDYIYWNGKKWHRLHDE